VNYILSHRFKHGPYRAESSLATSYHDCKRTVGCPQRPAANRRVQGLDARPGQPAVLLSGCSWVYGAHVYIESPARRSAREQASLSEEHFLHLWHVGERGYDHLAVTGEIGSTLAYRRAKGRKLVGGGRFLVRNGHKVMARLQQALANRQAHRAKADQSDSLPHFDFLAFLSLRMSQRRLTHAYGGGVGSSVSSGCTGVGCSTVGVFSGNTVSMLIGG
jgi:hypothetical protein